MRMRFSSFFFPVWVAATYLFLYIPIAVLVIFSFNEKAFPYRWFGFSLKWYRELFSSTEIWDAAKNSLYVGAASVFLSLTLGLLFVFWITQKKRDHWLSLFYGNIMIPEVMLAVGLLNFFVFFSVRLGLTTIIVGHTLIGLGYVVPIIHSRMSSLDPHLIEASLDLGATYRQTFFKIIIPALVPALMAGGILVFILSLDDFIVSFFCAGTSAQTLSLYIFAMIRVGVSPIVNALSAIMFVASSILVGLFCYLMVQDAI